MVAAGFGYTCSLTQVVALPEHRALTSQSVVFSTRAAWRRPLSVAWNTLVGWRLRDRPLLRLELHPGDCEHDRIRECWTRLLTDALHDRRAVRLSDAAALARRLGAANVASRR